MHDEEYEYYHDMLLLQFIASDRIKNPTTKGNLREKYLEDQIKRIGGLQIFKGHIRFPGGEYGPESDRLICPSTAVIHPDFSSVDCKSVICSLEVKSGLDKTILADVDRKAGNIKDLYRQRSPTSVAPTLGLISYSLAQSLETTLGYFGLSEGSTPPRFSNLDFVISLARDIETDTHEDFFIQLGRENVLTTSGETIQESRYFPKYGAPVWRTFEEFIVNHRDKLEFFRMKENEKKYNKTT